VDRSVDDGGIEEHGDRKAGDLIDGEERMLARWRLEEVD
jgi:hypothetical protein